MVIDYRADPATIAMEITCQLKAGRLLHYVSTGKLTRQQISDEIEAHPAHERECLRAWCNHYRRLAELAPPLCDKCQRGKK